MRRAASLSSFRSCFFALWAYSIVQAKVFPHRSRGVHFLLPLANPPQRLGGQIIPLHFGNAAFNNLAQIESLRTPRLHSQPIEPVRKFRRKPDRSSHSHPPREYTYSLYHFTRTLTESAL